MLYFTKATLARKYHISEKTVTNWIRETKNGKLDLILYEGPHGTRIGNATRNLVLIEELIEKRKKFRNSRGTKIATPKPEFYKLYSPDQILDIASSLEMHHEIPFQYDYFGAGADYWDKYAQRLAAEQMPNLLTSTIEQLRISRAYIDSLLRRYARVNVIDIGPGNALPVRELIQHLLDQNKMGRYIAIDISAAMLKIAERNIKSWFGEQVVFQGYEADINYGRFANLLTDGVVGEDANKNTNLILALGGTFHNLRLSDNAFRVVSNSMNRNDLLLYNLKLDTETARQYFDFWIDRDMPPIDVKANIALDMLNIDESCYEPEVGFDAQLMQRYIRIRLKVALTIKFSFERGERIVDLNKGDAILLWRSWHQNVPAVLEQLDRTDFDVLQTSMTEDKDYLLAVSRVKSQR